MDLPHGTVDKENECVNLVLPPGFERNIHVAWSLVLCILSEGLGKEWWEKMMKHGERVKAKTVAREMVRGFGLLSLTSADGLNYNKHLVVCFQCVCAGCGARSPFPGFLTVWLLLGFGTGAHSSRLPLGSGELSTQGSARPTTAPSQWPGWCRGPKAGSLHVLRWEAEQRAPGPAWRIKQ